MTREEWEREYMQPIFFFAFVQFNIQENTLIKLPYGLLRENPEVIISPRR
jgi:hypothetical protein